MWIAYAIPKQDLHLVVEDGIHYVAVGKTKREAIANLRDRLRDEQKKDDEISKNLGFEPEQFSPIDDFYVIHTNEVKEQ